MRDGEGINQRIVMYNPRTGTTMRGLPWGGDRVRLGGGGEGEKSGNNRNTLNNKKKYRQKLRVEMPILKSKAIKVRVTSLTQRSRGCTAT